MALTDKNIVITPNVGQAADPKIIFSGADATTAAQNITLQVYPTNNGTLSFEGSAGQLFSITNSLTGTIFSVNDVSGIPSIEVLDTGLVKIAQYSGNVLLGTSTDNGSKLQVNGSAHISGDLTVLGTTNFSSGTVTFSDPVLTLGGTTPPASDDNKDRGVEFNWHNGTSAKLGFYGWDDSASQFIFLSDSTVASTQYTGATISANYLAISPAATGATPTLSSQGVDTDINVDITPKGAGDVNLNADTVRVGDANAAATITTNGTGNLTLSTNAGTNSGTIVINQGANTNIVVTPNGTGDVQLVADTVQIGDANTDATVTTNGTGDLILNTNSGTNSGSIRIYDGANGNIDLEPNGTGDVRALADTFVVGDANAAATITTNGTGNLVLNTNSGTNSGTITINQGANANIDIEPNGTGDVNLNADTVRVGDLNTAATITTNGASALTITTGAAASATSAGNDISIIAGTSGATSGNGGAITVSGGNAQTSGAGGATTIKSGAAVGTNITGSTTTVQAGNGTGTGGSGNIVFQTAPAGTTGATGNTLTTRLTIDKDGLATFANNVTITGDLTVNGTTTTVNSTTITIDDKNIELGSVASPTNVTADGGGITLKGATDKTIIWDNANANWTSSENWNIATGKTFKVNNVNVLSDVAVLQNATAASIGSLAAATTVSVGANNQNNILNINANGVSGTATLTTNVTTGTVNTFTGVTTGTINVGSASTGKVAIAFTTESTSLTTGAVIISGGLAVAKNITATSFKYNNGESVGYTYDLDDISSKFNGVDTSFPLTINDGTAVTPNNPNKIKIYVGGVPVTPTKYIYDFVNLPEVTVFNDGYIVSGSTIQFATPPLQGMGFYGTYQTSNDSAPTFKYKQAPFSAINIILR